MYDSQFLKLLRTMALRREYRGLITIENMELLAMLIRQTQAIERSESVRVSYE